MALTAQDKMAEVFTEHSVEWAVRPNSPGVRFETSSSFSDSQKLQEKNSRTYDFRQRNIDMVTRISNSKIPNKGSRGTTPKSTDENPHGWKGNGNHDGVNDAKNMNSLDGYAEIQKMKHICLACSEKELRDMVRLSLADIITEHSRSANDNSGRKSPIYRAYSPLAKSRRGSMCSVKTVESGIGVSSRQSASQYGDGELGHYAQLRILFSDIGKEMEKIEPDRQKYQLELRQSSTHLASMSHSDSSTVKHPMRLSPSGSESHRSTNSSRLSLPASRCGFDGPVTRFPLVSREELLIQQAIDNLESSIPYYGGQKDLRNGGLSTTFVDEFTRCPTKQSKCGLRLRIEEVNASNGYDRYNNPRSIRIIGPRGVQSAMEIRPLEPPDDVLEFKAGDTCSRSSTPAEIKLDVAREMERLRGRWSADPDLYPSPYMNVDKRFAFRSFVQPSDIHKMNKKDFWLPASVTRPPGSFKPIGMEAPMRAISALPNERVLDSTKFQLSRGITVVGDCGVHFRLETPGLRAPSSNFFREAEMSSRRY